MTARVLDPRGVLPPAVWGRVADLADCHHAPDVALALLDVRLAVPGALTANDAQFPLFLAEALHALAARRHAVVAAVLDPPGGVHAPTWLRDTAEYLEELVAIHEATADVYRALAAHLSAPGRPPAGDTP